MVITAVGLIAAGVALLAVRRRRELTEDSAA
jgi:LPXTG-motif cell wall-anchored protein